MKPQGFFHVKLIPVFALTLGAFALLPNTAHANSDDWLISVSFASAESFVDGPGGRGDYLPTVFARPQWITRDIGSYVGIGIPAAEIFGRGQDSHSVTVVNAGLTYRLAEQLYAFGGPGYSYQRFSTAQVTETRERLNGNVGLMFVGNNFGITLSYDSGPNAIGVGFSVNSGWFGGGFHRR
ncbi:MAG: hypothetical protein JJU10_10855 [Idiomarina sp.]|nr:hypothetical protein [Idiomarina sp.]